MISNEFEATPGDEIRAIRVTPDQDASNRDFERRVALIPARTAGELMHWFARGR